MAGSEVICPAFGGRALSWAQAEEEEEGDEGMHARLEICAAGIDGLCHDFQFARFRGVVHGARIDAR
jgi:hypothetical protein